MNIPIAISIDNNVVVPAGVTLTSLCMNASTDTLYDIWILYINLNQENRDSLKQLESQFDNCNIHFYDCSDSIQSGFEIRGITTTCYLRLLIPRIMKEYDKVLYLDVDIIVLGDLQALYSYDLGINCFLGMRMKPLPDTYVNSGVLLINNKVFTEEDIDISVSLIKEQYTSQDQDIINKVYKDRIDSTLSPVYNFGQSTARRLAHNDLKRLKLRNSEKIIEEFRNNFTIIHYTGRKPWKELVEWGDFWWEYYRKSIFFDNENYICYQAKYSAVPSWKSIAVMIAKKLKGRSY